MVAAFNPQPMTPGELLGVARWQALRWQPYLGRLLCAVSFVEDTSREIDTLGIDERLRVYYSPAFVRQAYADDTLVSSVTHEALHPTLEHKKRGKILCVANHKHWNCCGDAEIWMRLAEIQATLAGKRFGIVDFHIKPEDIPGGQRGMTAEELYLLPQQGQSKKPSCSGGSGAGTPAPWELPADAPGAPPGLSPGEVKIVLAGTAADIRKHAEAKGRGSVPAGLLRWAEEWGDLPEVPWSELARARVQYAVDIKWGPVASYARPSRRGYGDFVLPVYREAIPKIAIVGDTSASMDQAAVGKIIGLTYDAISTVGSLVAVGCDAQATDPVEVRDVEDLREALRGGGGTDLTVGIERALETVPDVIVVVTDGDTPWPASPVDCDLVIILTEEPHRAPPAWAEVIKAY